MNADSQFRIFLLQLRDELKSYPVVLLLAVGDEHVVQVSQLLLIVVLVLPSLLHQPERNEESSPVSDDYKNEEYYPHSCQTNGDTLEIFDKTLFSSIDLNTSENRV